MKIYKLTDAKRRSGIKANQIITVWRKGFRLPRLDGNGPLCSKDWYHGYSDPLLAVLHNPIHANFMQPRCCVVEVAKEDVGGLGHGMKLGFRSGLVIDWIELPKVTLEQHIRYAILCSLSVYKEPAFVQWALNWLSGKDRFRAAKAAAKAEAKAAAEAEAAAWAAEATTSPIDGLCLQNFDLFLAFNLFHNPSSFVPPFQNQKRRDGCPAFHLINSANPTDRHWPFLSLRSNYPQRAQRFHYLIPL